MQNRTLFTKICKISAIHFNKKRTLHPIYSIKYLLHGIFMQISTELYSGKLIYSTLSLSNMF